MLHGPPADPEMSGAEIVTSAPHFTAIAPDTPGFGLFDPLPGDVLRVAGLAEAGMAALGPEVGVGWPGRVSGLLLEGVPLFTVGETEAIFNGYFAPMVPDPLGGHLTSTWVRSRDQFTWSPWCSRDVA